MVKIYKKYKLESDMCNELINYANHFNWISYPEQGGWDILLVRNNIQVGIQAKLRPTIKVLSQALTQENNGPHYRAIAIGNSHFKEKEDFAKIAFNLRLIFIDMGVHPDFWLHIPKRYNMWKHYRHLTKKVLWVPPFVPNLKAGIPSPKNVSPWKIASIKLELIAKEKGWVSIIDARNVVQQEVPIERSKSYSRTLLQSYFKCTKEKDPRNKNCKKWILKKKPSDQYSYVFNVLKGEKNEEK